MKKLILLSCYCLLFSSLGLGKSTRDSSMNQNSAVYENFDSKEVNAVLAVASPIITASYPYVICGTGTLTLNASPTNASYTYQWSFSTTENGIYSNISGATASTFVTNTTNNVGFYKVAINDGTTPALSPSFKVRVGGSASLVSATPATISAGGSSTLNFNFTGTAPWTFTLNGSNGTIIRDYTFSTSTAIISVTPDSYRSFYTSNVYDANGVGCQLGGATININPIPTLVLGTPTSITVCAGNVIDTPITLNGTWGNANNISITAELTTTAGTSITGSLVYGINGSSLKYVIPPGTPTGTYKIRAYGTYPSTGAVSTSYNITVANTGCGTNQPIITGTALGCAPGIFAYPQGSGYSYNWYKDNVLVSSGSTSPNYYPSANQSGNYTVLVTNTTLGFSGTSAPKAVTVSRNIVTTTATSSNLCSSPVTITSNYSGVGYTYQWFRAENQSNNTSTKTPISGQTSSTLSVATSGLYDVSVWDGTCQVTSNLQVITPCPPSITSTNPVLCGTNTQAILQANFSGSGTPTYQWTSSSTQFGTFTNISGATNSSYTTNTLGWYKVTATLNGNSATSNAFQVSNTTQAKLVNSQGNTDVVNLNPTQTETLQLQMYGQSPFSYNFNGQNYTSNVGTVPLPVSPSISTIYFATSVVSTGSACGTTSTSSNSLLVNVSPNPSFTIGTLPVSVCYNEPLTIPLTLTGNWGTAGNIRFYASLYTASGTYISHLGYVAGSPLVVSIPSTLTVGSSYKISLSAAIPYISTSQYTSNFTISGLCPADFTVQNSACSYPTLTASPSGSGYVFQWKKDGINVLGATNQTYSPQVSGNYSVNVQNTSLNYNSTSLEKAVIVNYVTPTITSPNPILCGSNTSATLTSSYTGAGYTYAWYKRDLVSLNNVIITGATSSSINVTDAGRYYVKVNNGICTFFSNAYIVTYGGFGTLTNSSNNNDKVILISPQTTENLQVNLTGTGPWEVGINDGFVTKLYRANTSTLTVPVSPTLLTRYSIPSVSSACGVNIGVPNTGTVIVDPSPVATITFPTPTNLTVCRGNSINIPYTATGSIVGSKSTIYAYLADATGGNTRNWYSGISLPIDAVQANGSFDLYIPDNVATGSYSLYSFFSNLASSAPYTNYAINVVNTGCSATPAPTILGFSSACESMSLTASIYGTFAGNNNTYQWFKNGVAMTGKTATGLIAYESGNYTVNVINGTYNQTSAAKSVTVNRVIPMVSSSNPVICGSNTSTTLNTNYTGVGYTYQWYKDRNFGNGTTEQIPIFGATNSSLTVTNAGAYSVKVFDGSCLQNSKSSTVDASGSLVPKAAFAVSTTATAKLTNLAGDNTAVTIGGAISSATLRVTFTGGGPWSFNLVRSDGNTTAYTNVATQVYDYTVSPVTNTNYSIANLTSSCGTGTTSGTVQVIVSPEPSMALNGGLSPNFNNLGSTNICPGSTIPISYTISGNWNTDRDIKVQLVDAVTNALVSGTAQNGYNTNPIQYFVPYSVPVGNYKISLTSNKPYIVSSVLSNYNINVTNTDCILPVATVRGSVNCSTGLLSASPTGSGFVYQWYKNGTAIATATNSYYSALENGNYTVNVSNSTTGFNSTSVVYPLAITEINGTITTNGGQICETGTATFISANTGSGFTHQWYYSATNIGFTAIVGATANTFTASQAGYYFVIIKNGDCELKSNTLNTCMISIDFLAKTVCSNSTVTVPFTFTGGTGQTVAVQLINANTNAVVVANLATITTSNSTTYNPSVAIPNTVGVGTYKFKIITGNPLNISVVGENILTVSNQTSGIVPTVTTSLSSILSAQDVTVTATGCTGDISWYNSDLSNSVFPSFTTLVSSTTTFAASCTDVGTGCVSLTGTATVTYGCTSMVSTKSGDWNDITVWSCGRLPLATDPVQIAPSHTVTLNANGVVKSLDLRGTLQKQGFSLQIQGN